MKSGVYDLIKIDEKQKLTKLKTYIKEKQQTEFMRGNDRESPKIYTKLYRGYYNNRDYWNL